MDVLVISHVGHVTAAVPARVSPVLRNVHDLHPNIFLQHAALLRNILFIL